MIPLDELRDVESADVYKGGVRAARLARRTESVAFAYDEAYVAQRLPAVATTLPLSTDAARTHAPGALPPFFSGMLPEGRRLAALRAAAKTSADDEFTMLLAVGQDAIGDVQVVPEGWAPEEVPSAVQVEDWRDVSFRALFAASVGGDGTVGPLDRVGIPGVQDKVSARMIGVPVARADQRFILKLDPPEFPHLVANEAFFLDAARRSGLEVAEAEVVHDVDGVPGLLVRRFDRVPDGSGGVRALAQEDGCQVLGRYPADKYRVSTEEVFGALSRHCDAAPVAALTLLKQVAFASLTCNGDAHAKNFSIHELEGGEWRVSPAYDLPSSYPYGDTSMALTLNGKRREDIGRRDFVALGAAIGVRERAVHRALDDLVAAMDGWVDRLEELPFDRGRVLKLGKAIAYRRGRM